MLDFQQNQDGITLSVKVIPNSSRDEIMGLHDTALKIKVSAPPENGKANQAVILALAKALHINKTSIKIISGQTQPHKQIQINGITSQDIEQLL